MKCLTVITGFTSFYREEKEEICVSDISLVINDKMLQSIIVKRDQRKITLLAMKIK